MALDQQSNWDEAMADNLRQVQSKHIAPELKCVNLPPLKFDESRPWLHLPDEIIIIILDHLRDAQATLAACCYISRQWHEAVLPYLYAKPELHGKAFELFARTICPSINLHVRKSPLSNLVREVDLGKLVHQGSKSMTARLLGRTKASLELFRAPQASFAINCLPALAKCSNLRLLDLSLVSESPDLPSLLGAIVGLQKLETLRLPRSAGYGALERPHWSIDWPPALQSLALSGGIDNHFLQGRLTFPQTLRDLIIEHCPHMTSSTLLLFLAECIRPLPSFESIRIAHMPRFEICAMDDLLTILPQVKKVSVSVDHISSRFFQGGNQLMWQAFSHLKIPPAPLQHVCLRQLEITSAGSSDPAGKVQPEDLLLAMDEECLPALRVVRVPKNIGWHQGILNQEGAELITEELQALNAEDREARRGIFEHMSEAQWKKADPDDSAGLWMYDHQ